MNPILEGALIAEKINGRTGHIHKNYGTLDFPEIRINHPRTLIVSDDKYIKFFVKNYYSKGLHELKRTLKSQGVRIEIRPSQNTTSVIIDGEYEELVQHIEKFQEYANFIEDKNNEEDLPLTVWCMIWNDFYWFRVSHDATINNKYSYI